MRSLQPTNAQPPLQPLPPLVRDTGVAPPRINGNAGSTRALPPAEIGTSPPVAPRGTVAAPPVPGAGTYQLDFADTDIREVVAQILGNMLMVNYVIDPAVHGTVTLRTAQPLNRSQLIPMLEMKEVRGIDTAATTSSQIQSPTFTERAVQSRVVVQDGQTVGLAGLISDTSSRGNSGIPWIKNVPILGLPAGSQSNARTRTELLVLLTPHVRGRVES